MTLLRFRPYTGPGGVVASPESPEAVAWKSRKLDPHGQRRGLPPQSSKIRCFAAVGMSDPSAKVIELPRLPLHTVGHGGVTRGRGRPQKVEAKPGRDDLEYHAQVLVERAKVLDADEIVRAASNGCDAPRVLRLVVEALAGDAALLAHARDELSKRGRDVAQITSRRAALLDRIASLVVEIDRHSERVLDVSSEAMFVVYKLWVDDLKLVAREVLSQEQIEVFFVKLEARFADFEDRAAAALR